MSNIKIKRFLIITAIITICSLFYVHQNIEILKIGYLIDNNQKVLTYFLDQHRGLIYNLTKLKSPLALDERLHAKNIKLIELDSDNIYYASAKHRFRPEFVGNSKNRMIDRVLDIFTEKAEAKTIKAKKNIR